jgi:hypothetical protein
MSADVKFKTKKYFVRVSGEYTQPFDTLGAARNYVKKTYSKVIPGSVLPSTVEIIKQVVVEEVIDVMTPQPMQILMVSDLDKDMY